MFNSTISDDGIVSDNEDSFVYSPYWGTWSRLLKRPGVYTSAVEVNLTPVNPDYADSWERNKDIIIRQHGTPIDPCNIHVSLPTRTYDEMIMRYGAELALRLIHEDFLPCIDFNKYRAICNGGAPLHLIKK